jgi:hypothetical protein
MQNEEMGFNQKHFVGDAKVVVDGVTTGDLDESRRGILLTDLRASLQKVPHVDYCTHQPSSEPSGS